MAGPQSRRYARQFWPFALLVVALAGCGSDGDAAGQNGTVAGTCSADADCAGLDDGNACNGSLRCDEALGVCKLDPATIVSCDAGDDNACRAALCDPATGGCALQPRNEGGLCDDGEPCSINDACKAGTCTAGKQNICGCEADTDCPDVDNNLCNGVPYCDKDHFPYACKDKPNSQVTCPGLDDPCKQNLCDPKTGGCTEVGVIGGTPCDDGDACTSGDACQGGSCKGGVDTCSCQQDTDCEDADGDPCTGVPYCDKSSGKGVCTLNPASVVVCSTAADTACRKNTCNKQLGSCVLTPVPDGDKVVCDDGDACTTGEVCIAGACTGGVDTCKCSSDAECAGQDDGNLCNGTMFCNLQSGKCEVNPATSVTCPTVGDTACSKNVCIPKTGQCEVLARDAVKKVGCSLVDLGGGILVDICLFQPKQDGETADPGPFACEDGNPCTAGDVCEGGACKTGQSVCECKTNADCAAKDDGDLCNGVLFCNGQSGKCEIDPSSVVTCKSVDDTACVKNTCNPKLGVCQPKQIEGPCDDGEPCTKGDLCKLGQCAPGTFTCECKEDKDCAGKDDGNLCNGVPFCDKTGPTPACKTNPATVVTCPSVDDTTCLKNQCQPKTGQCVPTQAAPETPCDDGDACTASDTCKLGQCQGGAFICECKQDLDCKDDGDLCNGIPFCDKSAAKPVCKVNPQTAITCPNADDTACLKNTCQKTSGACVPTPVPPETQCDDGDACTTGDVCKLGQCTPGAFTCECKEDVDCVGKDDGDPCNGVWFCDKSGAKPACKPQPNSEVFCPKGDDTACLKNTCDPKTVQCKLSPVKPGTPCDDGEACTVEEYCDAGDCKGGKPNACDDGDKCTVDSCDAKTGCKHTPKSCDDGNDCTVEACDDKTGNCSAPAAAKAGTLCNGDDKGCTVGDACDGKSACVTGAAVACKQPSDLCKEAVCQDKGGTDYACVEATRADGSDCDDATSCKVGATCKSGKCQTAPDDTLYSDLDITPKGAWLQLNGISAAEGRDFYIGGSWRSNQSASASGNAGFLWRMDVRGKLIWSRTVKGYDLSSTAVTQVRTAPQDGVVAAAQIRRVSGNTNLSTR
ncbi:MAG: hypothetical protein H6747_14485, partial [Deltaproteobacteria bacterium]|nr:hypothetical protein [Deltaproteobacteria bacterium]